MSFLNIDKSWTLFLDRDGVINEKRENDYVKNWDEFVFIKGSVEAIKRLNIFFGRIIVVTNQRCVGKGLVSENELLLIHNNMLDIISSNNGRIDKIYFCPDLLDNSECRKPNIGMALSAKSDFPEIEFEKSVIVGDSYSDMLFGYQLGMTNIFVSNNKDSINLPRCESFKSLFDFCSTLEKVKLYDI